MMDFPRQYTVRHKRVYRSSHTQRAPGGARFYGLERGFVSFLTDWESIPCVYLRTGQHRGR